MLGIGETDGMLGRAQRTCPRTASRRLASPYPGLEKVGEIEARPHGPVHTADSPHGDAGAGGSEKTACRHPAGPIGRRKMCPSWTPTRE